MSLGAPPEAARYVDFVAALVAGRLGELRSARGRSPFACPSCRRAAPRDVLVRRLGRVGCPECVPREKRCSRCGIQAPVEQFATPKGHVLSLCVDCRRARERERYVARRSAVPPTSEPRACSTCGVVKRAEEFYPNARYRGGRMSECRDCRSARLRRYERTAKGRETRRRIAASYRARHPAPSRTSLRSATP